MSVKRKTKKMMFQFRKANRREPTAAGAVFQPIARRPSAFNSPKACSAFKVTKPLSGNLQSLPRVGYGRQGLCHSGVSADSRPVPARVPGGAASPHITSANRDSSGLPTYTVVSKTPACPSLASRWDH